MQRKTTEERFWEKVKKGKEDECWNWIGYLNNNRYGRIKTKGKYILTHRFSYKIHKGEIPSELFICHSCDNPSCVNPNHLWLGTPYDNVQDMIKKGRHNHKYETKKEAEAARKARMKAYRKTLKRMSYEKNYRQTPERKIYQKIYQQTPAYKTWRKSYQQTPEYKSRKKELYQLKKGNMQ